MQVVNILPHSQTYPCAHVITSRTLDRLLFATRTPSRTSRAILLPSPCARHSRVNIQYESVALGSTTHPLSYSYGATPFLEQTLDKKHFQAISVQDPQIYSVSLGGDSLSQCRSQTRKVKVGLERFTLEWESHHCTHYHPSARVCSARRLWNHS